MNKVLRSEIDYKLDTLPDSMQGKVLQYLNSLLPEKINGIDGKNLLRFAGTISDTDAKLMIDAISDCERIEYENW